VGSLDPAALRARLVTARDAVTAALALVDAAVPAPIAWGAKMSPALRDRCRIFAQDFGTHPDWLPACMAFETMESFRPDIRPLRNGKRLSSAVGLIQFLEGTAKRLGTTTAALAAMSAERQFDYVWRYFRDTVRERGPIRSLEDCYMAIHWPAAVGKPDDATMYLRGSDAYAANAGLDLDGDHVITKAEAGSLIRAKLAKGRLPGYLG
jgi:hypothetical protein